ncbi:DUF4240 domain-containing protein [Dactylosporangium sp. CA-233914]|uniref:DUF4240 domain-containing protein n=1 Tax=Dactylosporangium sp. CA-233914 TaxID=3239934 RepID=UPI003D91EC5A
MDVPDRFWNVLEAHAPSTQRLTAWLRGASEDEIVAFQLAYELAAEEITDYWDGPVVDGVPYSEDDTEDLCQWIVAQGRPAWEAARSGPAGLTEAIRRYVERDLDDAWIPGSVAHAIFYDRFHASLDERMSDASGEA